MLNGHSSLPFPPDGEQRDPSLCGFRYLDGRDALRRSMNLDLKTRMPISTDLHRVGLAYWEYCDPSQRMRNLHLEWPLIFGVIGHGRGGKIVFARAPNLQASPFPPMRYPAAGRDPYGGCAGPSWRYFKVATWAAICPATWSLESWWSLTRGAMADGLDTWRTDDAYERFPLAAHGPHTRRLTLTSIGGPSMGFRTSAAKRPATPANRTTRATA